MSTKKPDPYRDAVSQLGFAFKIDADADPLEVCRQVIDKTLALRDEVKAGQRESERFRRERDALADQLVAASAALGLAGAPSGRTIAERIQRMHDAGHEHRVRSVEYDRAHEALDVIGIFRSGSVTDRVRVLAAQRDDLTTLLADIESLLPPPTGDDQGIVSRVRRVVLERDADRIHIDVARKMLDGIEAVLPPREPDESGLVQRVKGVVSRGDEFRAFCHDAHKILTDAHIPCGMLPERVAALVARPSAASAHYTTQQALHRIADAVGHAYHPRDGVSAAEVADAVGAYARRHEHPAVLPAPSEQAVLARLLDVLDACDVDEPARHALAAVRAVVGVERG